ncbi:hypothetical protein DL98DRAFT_149043 [Cadophora sp. DSE1049]|nr:hypothetical protein DL98DRAFT_149043 [Cadophora sp. DSE1049]
MRSGAESRRAVATVSHLCKSTLARTFLPRGLLATLHCTHFLSKTIGYCAQIVHAEESRSTFKSSSIARNIQGVQWCCEVR